MLPPVEKQNSENKKVFFSKNVSIVLFRPSYYKTCTPSKKKKIYLHIHQRVVSHIVSMQTMPWVDDTKHKNPCI